MALVLATKVGTGCNRRPAHHSYAINLQQTTHIGRLYTILNSHIFCLNIFMMTPNTRERRGQVNIDLNYDLHFLWANCWNNRGSKMFSSGSQVECFGLHPFHLTKYSVLPFLSLFLVMASAAKTWSPSWCSWRPSISCRGVVDPSGTGWLRSGEGEAAPAIAGAELWPSGASCAISTAS